MMKARIGARLTWDNDEFVVIAIDYRHARLRSLSGDFVREVVVEELVRMSDVVWHDLDATAASPADLRMLDALTKQERAVVDAWVEQLKWALAVIDSGGDTMCALEDARQAMAPLVEVKSVETVRRKLSRYRAEGVLGLLDRRGTNHRPPAIDSRIGEALSVLGKSEARKSSGTHARTVDRVRWMMEEDFGDAVAVPSDRTLYRMIAAHPTAGRLNSSARARQVAANKPSRAFGVHGALRPGEHVQVDTTVIDVPSRLVDGRLNRAELTIMHDVATRSILAAVMRAIATNSADLAWLLARALTPYDLRPAGAREQRERMAATWAGQFLIEQDRLDRHRLAQPFIFPETLTVDNGKIYRSEAFRRACERLGISLIFASNHTPTDKPHVEGTFGTMKTLFVQYLEGFTGGSVEMRGRDEPGVEVLALQQLQELLEDWVAVSWQNRAHDGLVDPLLPGRTLTPNEMFRAYRRVAPEISVPFGVNDFIGLLPSKRATLQDYGINFARRVYRSQRLPELRAAGAGGEGATRPCSIRFDPHNPIYVWVEHGDEFVPFRAAREMLDDPMGVDVWRAARDADPDSDAEVRADAVWLTDRMKRAQWVRPGAKRNRAVRSAQIDMDPMHLTGTAQTDAREQADIQDEPTGDEVVWERGGGFSLLSDDDGVWERLT